MQTRKPRPEPVGVGRYHHLDEHATGVKFLEQPRHEVDGTVVVFRDVAGNRWVVLGPPAVAA